MESDNESSIPGDDLPEDILEAAEIAGNDDDVPCSPPPPYDYVLEEQCTDYPYCEDEENVASTPTNGPVIVHTSSKEFYKAVAKQFGLTCKMSDDCRCCECQSRYFDYSERTEHEKSDGGLGAGTPMFINEAMQGSVCNIL